MTKCGNCKRPALALIRSAPNADTLEGRCYNHLKDAIVEDECHFLDGYEQPPYKEQIAMTDSCPVCEGDLYRGTYRDTPAYKCMTSNDCELSNTPIGRTKPEVRRVIAALLDS